MTSRAGFRFVIALAAMVAAAGGLSLFRPGYTPDEEFTLFAVRGIAAHGLPLLPSGLLYDRGLLYSYVARLAGLLTITELPAFRAIGLACGAVTLVVGFTLIRRVASPAAGVVSALLVATSLPFWAVITTGRFYAPFLLTCVALLWLLRAEDSVRKAGAIVALAFAARLLHELGFTLVAVPAAALVLSFTDGRGSPEIRRHGVMASLAVLAGLGAAQALLMALHFLMPPSDGGSTMIRRFFFWQVLNLFERPAGAPLGAVFACVIVGLLFAPRRALRVAGAGALAAAAVIAAAIVYDPPTAASPGGLRQALGHSLAYPLDMFWYLATAHPVMVWVGLGSMGARLAGAGGEWPIGERAAHLGWVGWVLWFGVIESGITVNYELLPATCLLTAIALDLVAIGEHTAAIWSGRRAQLIRAGLVGVALLVIADQWRGPGSLPQRLARARPTLEVPGIESIGATLQPGDRVACTDELACLLLVGRADIWLALDDYVRERFVVVRGVARAGVYAGAPAAFTLSESIAAEAAASRLIVVDVFKEYPVGNSGTWLPRALAAEHIDARTLLDTPQARVVEIRRQEGGDRNQEPGTRNQEPGPRARPQAPGLRTSRPRPPAT